MNLSFEFYLVIMQDIFMKIITNLDKLWIKLKMVSFHRKVPNYFMMLSIVYYVIMEISMFYLNKTNLLFLFSFSYMLLADYESYIKCQDRVNDLFKVSFFFL
jgi:hypothetical protein